MFSNSELLSIFFFFVLFLACIAFYISPCLVVLVYVCAVKSTDSSSLSSNMQLLIFVNNFTIYLVRFTSFFHNLDLFLNELQDPLPTCVLKSVAYKLLNMNVRS